MQLEYLYFEDKYIRTLVDENNEKYVTFSDFDKATGCNYSIPVKKKYPESYIVVSPYQEGIPSELFIMRKNLSLTPLRVFRYYINSIKRPNLKVYNWINNIDTDVDDSNNDQSDDDSRNNNEHNHHPEVISNNNIENENNERINDNRQLKKFSFNSEEIRVIDNNNEPWFVAKDICDILGLTNITMAVNGLDDEDKKNIVIHHGSRGNPTLTIINEPGLYQLIFNSRKDKARDFKKWVMNDVLPQIRQTGKFTLDKDKAPDIVNSLFSEIEGIKRELNRKMDELSNVISIDAYTPKREVGEKIEHNIMIGKINQLSNNLYDKISSEFDLDVRVWRRIWNEITYFVTGYEKVQLISKRKIPENEENGILKLMTEDELKYLINFMEYILRNIDNMGETINKDNVVRIIEQIGIKFNENEGKNNGSWKVSC